MGTIRTRRERLRRFGWTWRGGRGRSMGTQLRSAQRGSASSAWMRRRARSDVCQGAPPGRAVSRRRGRLPGASRDVPWFARSAIGIGTGASLRCAGTARMTSMPGWSARVGRWPTGGTRRHTLARRRRRKRRSAERGEGNSFLHGIGARAIAWISPLGTFLASVHVIEVPATSRGTSATAPGSASTTFLVVETMNARASVGREARSISAPKPKREQPAGGERAVDRAHCG